MTTLFFERIRYYSLITLTIAGVMLLAWFLFTHLIIKGGYSDGTTPFIYWIDVLFILSITGICFYYERPKENKIVDKFGSKLENLFWLFWAFAGCGVVLLFIVGFLLILILGNSEFHTWPHWAIIIEGSFLSIAILSGFLGLILCILQIFVRDDD